MNNLLFYLQSFIGWKLSQDIVGMAYFCSSMSGASAGILKGEGQNHLKTTSCICPVGAASCLQRPWLGRRLDNLHLASFSSSGFHTIWWLNYPERKHSEPTISNDPDSEETWLHCMLLLCCSEHSQLHLPRLNRREHSTHLSMRRGRVSSKKNMWDGINICQLWEIQSATGGKFSKHRKGVLKCWWTKHKQEVLH